MAKYYCVLFDADNTLLNFDAAESKALAETLVNYGIEPDAETVQTYRTINEELWKQLEKGQIRREKLMSERFTRFLKAVNAAGNGVEMNRYYLERLSTHPDLMSPNVLEVLSDVGIDDPERRYKQYPHEFSGGMRQRVVIAIAVACRPKILICDEPTTALDVTIQAQILELIKAMQKKYDLTTIYITHDLGVVANVADRIAVMYAGDIVELGTCDEVFYDPRHPYTWALLSSLPQLGTKDEPLYSIQGTPPNLFHEVKGDAFAPRNPKALKIDFVERPPFFEVTPTHYARTWLMDPRAPKVEPPEHVRILREKGVNRVG